MQGETHPQVPLALPAAGMHTLGRSPHRFEGSLARAASHGTQVYAEVDGEDVYAGVRGDFVGDEVNWENLKHVLMVRPYAVWPAGSP